MRVDSPPEVIKILAHDLRWRLAQSLAMSDYRVNELVKIVDHPLNLVSYHLRQLRDSRLVTTRRSEADRRDIYYSLDLEYLSRLYRSAGAAIHPTLVGPRDNDSPLASKPRVLFVCTHNSARSQMAEGLMRHLSDGQVDVSSAGSDPRAIHQDAIRTMDALGIDIRSQRAQGFGDFVGRPFDTIITVCDRAREICPTFPGAGQFMHWGLPDPTMYQDDAERRQAFAETARGLQARIEHYLHRY